MLLRSPTLPLCGLLLTTASGCSTAPSSADLAAQAQSAATVTQTMLSPGGYDAAFNTAREVLRENRFLLERVDAAAGVITTQRSTATREPIDVIQRRARLVVVSFAPAGSADANSGSSSNTNSAVLSGGNAPLPADLRDTTTPLSLTVRVIIERIEVPGWQIPPSSVRLASRTSDPEKVAADLEPLYTVPVGEDTQLSRLLLSQIESRLAAGTPTER